MNVPLKRKTPSKKRKIEKARLARLKLQRTSTRQLRHRWFDLRDNYSATPIISFCQTYIVNLDKAICNKLICCIKFIKKLHEEILDIYNFLKPTAHEYKLRCNLITHLKESILRKWPKALVEVFGSFKTGLYLPTSDIDIVVFGKWPQLPLFSMKEILLSSNLAQEKDIQLLQNARVPLVKFKDCSTHLNIDISFNMVNGIETSQVIKDLISPYSFARPLIIVLKHFLLQRRLNEVFTGGLSSYSLILMIINFIQNHSRLKHDISYLQNPNNDINPSINGLNLGVLLLEFFEHFGRHHNYNFAGLRVIPPSKYITINNKNDNYTEGSDQQPNSKTDHSDPYRDYYYFPKAEYADLISTAGRTSLVCIQDPLTPENDVGKNSWAFAKCKRAFEYAYVTLSRSVLPAFYNERSNGGSHKTVLGQIIAIPQDVLDYREWLKTRKITTLSKSYMNNNNNNNDVDYFDNESTSYSSSEFSD